MTQDPDDVEVLDRSDCLVLMRSVTLGRVVFTERALPAVKPVHFVLDDEDVIIATAPGCSLATAAHGMIVAFEVDAFEPAGEAGWSVTVIGQACPIRLRSEIDRLSRLPLESWTPGRHDCLIRIRGDYVSGRRIHPTFLEATS